MILKEKGFVLRNYRRGDEASLQGNVNNRNVSKHMCNISYPYTYKDAKKWIEDCIKSYNSKNKDKITLAIDINGKVFGGIAIHDIKGHKAEFGYWLAQNYWGRGIMTKAVRLMVNHCFKNLNLKRVYAYTFADNKQSARVLEKNGFKKEGLIEKHATKNGKFVDCYLYAKTK